MTSPGSEAVPPATSLQGARPEGATSPGARPPVATTPTMTGQAALRVGAGLGPLGQGAGTESSSSAGTSEIKSMLRRRIREQDRPKSSIGSVKIEEFHGERKRFRAWRRATEAQEHLYKLEPSELAMLLYLSTRGEARDTLDQRPLSDFTAPGELTIMWALLEETFGESSAESFERAEKELSQYRRLPGQSVASYVAGLKRLRMNYTVEDPDSTWSNKAWAQRMLNRAGLNRRDRLDVFYSAGGKYESDAIERALRHRCSHVHEEERRIPFATRGPRSARSSSSASTTSGATTSTLRTRSTRKHGVHVAGQQPEEEVEENPDEEDLEQEELSFEPGDQETEELGEDLDDEPDQESTEEAADVFEAFQAGWKAKSKAGGKRKARGFRSVSAPSGAAGSPSRAALVQKKKSSTCASCGAKGHWRGDMECPNVQSGKDAPHRPGGGQSSGANEVNFVNFTFMVGSMAECPSCGHFCEEEAAFCAKCGTRLSKRGWTVIEEPAPGTLPGSGVPPDPGASRPMRVEVPKAALAKTTDKDKKVRLKPIEVLGAMDQLSKEEKKPLRTLLQEEETEAAWATLASARPFSLDPESVARGSSDFVPLSRRGHAVDEQDERQARDQLPLYPGSKAAVYSGPIQPPPVKDERGRDKAKAVKQKELDDFRRELHARQCEGTRCVPSKAAPRPSEAQARCRHHYQDLLWTANQHGHFARCAKCDLKHVIYYSVRHGVLMVNQEEQGPEHGEGPVWSPGLAVADTGCRTAVGGTRWHQALQHELKRRGVSWQTVREREVFQFGSGPPVVSQRAFLYPVAMVPGQVDVLRMSEVSEAAASCPGLVGPSELARWSVQFEFKTREIVILGKRQPMRLTPTRHPALDLLCCLPEGDPWSAPSLLDKAKLLRSAPQSLAFVTGVTAPSEGEQSSACTADSSEQETEEMRGEDPRHWRQERQHTRKAEDQRWLDFLQDDLGVRVIPDHRLVRDRQPLDDHDAWSTASTELRPDLQDDGDSITSHEFGVEFESSETDLEDTEQEPLLEGHAIHYLHKEKRRKLNQASRAIRDMAASARPVLTVAPKPALRSRGTTTRRPGPWRILEVFACSMTISLMAAAQGWDAGQPVAPPGFDLTRSDARRAAKDYVGWFSPDLLVLSWPAPLSSPPLPSYGVSLAVRLPAQQAHAAARAPLWRFAHDLLLQQRARGALVLCRGPVRSAVWDHPLLQHALAGLPQARTDLCAWSRCPTELRQPLMLAGDADLLRHLVRRCPGHPHHRHPFPSESRLSARCYRGRWFVDGRQILPKRWCEAVVYGAEVALRQRGRMLVAPVCFAAGALSPEEAFVEDDEEAMHDAPAPEGLSEPEGWLDGLQIDTGDFDAPRGGSKTKIHRSDAHSDQVPHNNNDSNPEGGPQQGVHDGSDVDDTHSGLVPNNNNDSNPEGGPQHIDQLRDLLSLEGAVMSRMWRIHQPLLMCLLSQGLSSSDCISFTGIWGILPMRT